MNIFVRELQAHRKSTVIWAASLIAVIVVFMSMYPAFTADVALSTQVLQQFPKALLDAMDLSPDDFFTIFGFFGYLMNFVILAGSIQAMNLGVEKAFSSTRSPSQRNATSASVAPFFSSVSSGATSMRSSWIIRSSVSAPTP